MTTLEPGARVVLTQGLRDRPRSTAFFARRAAPIITYGLDVFVQEVIAAITTWPWSSVVSVPSSSVTATGCVARAVSGVSGSEAGNEPLADPTYAGSASRNAVLALVSSMRSCGRFGPAIDG